jgi:hypothetical protein
MLINFILRSLKWGDWLVAGFLLTGVLGSTLFLSLKNPGQVGFVEVDGETVLRIPLDRTGDFPVQGITHPAVIRVSADGFEILDDRCPNPSFHSGRIIRQGEFRICFPNRLLIRVPDSGRPDPSQPDAVSW